MQGILQNCILVTSGCILAWLLPKKHILQLTAQMKKPISEPPPPHNLQTHPLSPDHQPVESGYVIGLQPLVHPKLLLTAQPKSSGSNTVTYTFVVDSPLLLPTRQSPARCPAPLMCRWALQLFQSLISKKGSQV